MNNINIAVGKFIIVWSKHLNPSQAISLVTGKIQIKTTVRYHFTPIRMASIKQNKTKKPEDKC